MKLRIALTCAALMTGSCDSGPSMAESLKQADQKEKERKAAEKKKKAEIEVKKDPDKLENPWTFDDMKASLQMGVVLVYTMSGTDAKGKQVSDEYRCEVKGNNEKSVGVTAHRMSEKNEPIAKQTATTDWSNLSPFFALEKAEAKVVGRETVKVPGGEFDAVVAEMKGFFGNQRTVWMIPDKAGIYAKVVDHGNVNEASDKLEIVYELKEIAKR